MPEAAYDVRRPNGSPLSQDSQIRSVWRLYRINPLPELAPVPGGPFQTLANAQSKLRKARDFTRSLSLPTGRGTLVKEIRSVLLLRDLAMETDVRSSFTYVRDGQPGNNFFIDMPFRNAKGITHIRLLGRTFRGPITVNGVKVDGQAALNEFEKFFESYLNPEVGTPADYRMYWINLDAPVSAEDPFGASEWWIHPPRKGLRKTKSVQRPHDWFWSIEFLGLQSNRDAAKSEDGLLSSLLGTDALRALLEKFGLDGVVGFIEQVFGLIDEFRGLIDDLTSIVTAVTDYITGVSQTIRAAIARVRGALADVQELISRVEQAIEQVGDLPNLIASEASLVRQSYPGIVESESNGIQLNDALRSVRDLLAALVAQPQNFAELVDGAPILPQTITVQVQPGITIERLAKTSNTDVNTLIQANQIEYPFMDSRERPEAKAARIEGEIAAFQARDDATIAAGGAAQYTESIATLQGDLVAAELEVQTNPALPHVLYAGDPIRLPQERPELIPSVVGISGDRLNIIAAATGAVVTEEERLFGIDLALTQRGDLEWDPDLVDLRVVRGLDNIGAALSRYMRLPLGALRFAPEIGNFAFDDLARWQTKAESRMLAMSIHQTLSQDPRVRRILDINAVTHEGESLLKFNAELIDGRRVPDLRTPLPEAA